MVTVYEFGYLERPINLENSTLSIQSSTDYDFAVPLDPNVLTYCSPVPPTAQYPFNGIWHSAERYTLPINHSLLLKETEDEKGLGEFLVVLLGFLYGLRLTIKGTGHLRPTPIKIGSLVNFCPSDRDVLEVMSYGLAFWQNNNEQNRRLLFSAMHYYLISQSYTLQYERFSWSYTVLDNLYRITANQRSLKSDHAHPKRPAFLSDSYGSPLCPEFSDPEGLPGNGHVLSSMRNELVHEARWLGEPLGYAVSADAHHIILSLQHYCSQIILGVLNVPCEFRKHCYSYQIEPLGVGISTQNQG